LKRCVVIAKEPSGHTLVAPRQNSRGAVAADIECALSGHERTEKFFVCFRAPARGCGACDTCRRPRWRAALPRLSLYELCLSERRGWLLRSSIEGEDNAPPAREMRRTGFKNHPARHYEYDCGNGGGGDPESSAYRTCRPRSRGWLKKQGGVGFGRSSILAEEISLTKGTADQANYDNYTPLRGEQMPTSRCILCRRRTRQLASAVALRDREALLIDQGAPRSRRP
jgi:hypothetical protein